MGGRRGWRGSVAVEVHVFGSAFCRGENRQHGSGEKSVVEESEGSLPPGQGSRVVEGAEGSAAQSPVLEEEEIGLGGIGL